MNNKLGPGKPMKGSRKIGIALSSKGHKQAKT